MGCRLCLLLLLQAAELVLHPAQLEGHEAQVYCVRFTKNGNRLLSGARDGTVRVWDPEKGREERVLDAGRRAVHRMDLTPDEKLLYFGDRGGELGILDMEPGRTVRVWDGHEGWISAVDVRADGRQLLTAASDSKVKLWSLDGPLPTEQFTLDHAAPVFCAAYNASGTRAASGDDDGWLKIWDTATGKELRSFRAHAERVGGVAFSPDGEKIATVGTACKIWRVTRGGPPLHTMAGGTTLQAVAFSPDGKYVAAGGKEDFVRVWAAATGKKVAELYDQQQEVDKGLVDMKFAPVGLRLAVPHLDRIVRVWSAKR
jgi:WD40 repeat protein